MIKLNGYDVDFCCASGALAFDGKGWWFERPWYWLGYLRPQEMTIIIKTLTYHQRKGNYRWWCPWRSVRLLKDNGVVNAIGLTNIGHAAWIKKIYPRLKYKVIVSFTPESLFEASDMLQEFNLLDLIAVELNLSCPNVKKLTFEIPEMIDHCKKISDHPVIVKLSVTHPIVELCRVCKPDAWNLINSVPWQNIFEGDSPLKKYNLVGGVSGSPIKDFARNALTCVRDAGITTPIISGGGIDSKEEVELRFRLGANAVAFGSIFIRKPWLPNQIIQEIRNDQARVVRL